MIPGITAYLPPTKSPYRDPTKTKAVCNKKEQKISKVISSFF